MEYRRQNGQLIFVPMGIVVQEMVPAEAAGVLFSRDPLSGDPSKIIITANYGLGEVGSSKLTLFLTATAKPRSIKFENCCCSCCSDWLETFQIHGNA